MKEIERLTLEVWKVIYDTQAPGNDWELKHATAVTRAILTAMREPVDVEAAVQDIYWLEDGASLDMARNTVRAAITAHIDAILGEGRWKMEDG